jgi:beta-glucosidase
MAWQPGLEAGNAVADVVSGKVNPSGKLTSTFPMKYEDEVTAKNFPGIEFPEKATTGMLGMKSIPGEVTYEEGVYVGYRYYNTFNVKPAYEFGYGLSYTNFAYSNLKLSKPTFDGSITATIDVINTGKTAGKEVVEIYLSAPAKKMDKPGEELKAFAKTNLLQPGEKQSFSFTLQPKDLASFDTNATAWVAEAGEYTLNAGASSSDIRQKATFSLSKDQVVEKVNKVLVPQITITELKH